MKKGDKRKGYCTHCHQEGHLKENHFRLIVYPDWYKGKKYTGGYNQQLKSVVSNEYGMHATYMTATPLEEVHIDDNNRIIEINTFLGLSSRKFRR